MSFLGAQAWNLGEQSYKKNWFFLDIVRTSETPPPPPINFDTPNFSVKENFGLSQTPPPLRTTLLYEKISKNKPVLGKISKKMGPLNMAEKEKEKDSSQTSCRGNVMCPFHALHLFLFLK